MDNMSEILRIMQMRQQQQPQFTVGNADMEPSIDPLRQTLQNIFGYGPVGVGTGIRQGGARLMQAAQPVRRGRGYLDHIKGELEAGRSPAQARESWDKLMKSTRANKPDSQDPITNIFGEWDWLRKADQRQSMARAAYELGTYKPEHQPSTRQMLNYDPNQTDPGMPTPPQQQGGLGDILQSMPGMAPAMPQMGQQALGGMNSLMDLLAGKWNSNYYAD